MRGIFIGGILLAGATLAVGCAKDPYISPVSGPVGASTPTPGAPTPTPTPVTVTNLMVNGSFEAGSLTPWFVCYPQHHQASEADPYPSQAPSAFTSPTPGPDTGPLPAASQMPSTDATIQTSTPTGSVYAGSYAALVGYSSLVGGVVFRETGASGICQSVAIPATGNPQLSLAVYEGGNNANYSRNDQEADVFAASAGLTAASNTTTTLPVQTLFAENNCYNNLNVHNTTSDETPCNPGGSLQYGGQWYQKGPFSLSAYAGQTITIFLGTWNNTGGTGTSYFSYAYFDNVVLTN
jgi:hypothetical protein